MGDHLLSAIITLEKELQSQVQKESARAAAWREHQFAELAREEQEFRATLATTRLEQLEAARQAAEARGEEQLTATRNWCARLESLPDAICLAQLQPLLDRLLPEAGDDYPHGQG